jgi:hypothetical protein
MRLVQKSPAVYSSDVSTVAVFQPETPTPATPEQIGDSIFDVFTTTGGYNEFKVEYALDVPVTVESQNPEIFTFDGSVTSRVASGVGTLLFDFGNHKKKLTLDLRDLGPSTARYLSGYASGTYGAFAWAQINTHLDAEKDALYYNGSSYSACASQPGGIARNPNCWGAAYVLSGVAVSYLSGGFWGGGELITPRHYICSNHYNRRNKVGEILRFVGNTGTVRTRTILAQTTGHENNSQPGFPGNPEIPVGDLCVFLLSDDYTNDVAVYPVAGEWAVSSEFVESTPPSEIYDVEYALPFITTNQNRKVLFSTASTVWENFKRLISQGTSEVAGITVNRPAYVAFFKHGVQSAEFTDFQSKAITGDSGSPVFTVLADNGLALYTVMTYPTNGSLIHEEIANAMIVEVDTRYGISTGLTVTVAPDPLAEP